MADAIFLANPVDVGDRVLAGWSGSDISLTAAWPLAAVSGGAGQTATGH